MRRSEIMVLGDVGEAGYLKVFVWTIVVLDVKFIVKRAEKETRNQESKAEKLMVIRN